MIRIFINLYTKKYCMLLSMGVNVQVRRKHQLRVYENSVLRKTFRLRETNNRRLEKIA